ncbi:hypothetical protein Micbo1qcDRAFT_158860, partial [Microdochium bolleyi]
MAVMDEARVLTCLAPGATQTSASVNCFTVQSAVTKCSPSSVFNAAGAIRKWWCCGLGLLCTRTSYGGEPVWRGRDGAYGAGVLELVERARHGVWWLVAALGGVVAEKRCC